MLTFRGRLALVPAILVGAPGAPALVPLSLAPNTIAFWTAQRGLIGTGYSYCDTNPSPCRGRTISLTEDGGKTSRVLLRTSGPVSWVSVARRGFAWALVDSCSKSRGCTPQRFLRSTDGGRSWQSLPHVVLKPSFADGVHGLALSNGSCEPAWCFRARLLATSDGGRSWRSLRSPCPGEAQAASLATPNQAWLLCAGEPGAGNQMKSVYRTTNGGRTWLKTGALPDYGYGLGLSLAPDGVGLLWESRGTLFLTADAGLHWQPLAAVARPEVDFGSSASVVDGRAFALLSRGSAVERLVAATLGYRGWKTVRTWQTKLPPA